jgi:hypothetical protein
MAMKLIGGWSGTALGSDACRNAFGLTDCTRDSWIFMHMGRMIQHDWKIKIGKKVNWKKSELENK